MRTALQVTVALAASSVLLVGCGTDDTTAGPAEGGTSSEPTQKSDEPSPSEDFPPGPIPYTAIALVSASNAEGSTSPRAVVLDNRKAMDEFAGQFSGGQMLRALNREYARADLPKDEVMLGAVVDVSCQAPTGLQVKKTDGGVQIAATEKPSAKGKEVQCLVPVTTVALVSVPEEAV
jgi:uncharacterized lipoprotein